MSLIYCRRFTPRKIYFRQVHPQAEIEYDSLCLKSFVFAASFAHHCTLLYSVAFIFYVGFCLKPWQVDDVQDEVRDLRKQQKELRRKHGVRRKFLGLF